MAKIIVAFDNGNIDDFYKLHTEIGDTDVLYKFGLEFAEKFGPQGIKDTGIPNDQIFIDHKWADISATVEGAANSALEHFKPGIANVFGLSGRASMAAFAQKVTALSPQTVAIAVTALTSWSDTECVEMTMRDCETFTRDCAAIAHAVGCGGVVCHTRSVVELRQRYGKDFIIITPGIRFPEDAVNDQHNPAHPTAAAKAGSNFLVVGRPILKPTEGTRRDAALRFIEAATL